MTTQTVPLFAMPSAPFSLRRSYWTDVLTSRSGKEHRRANRAFPRRHVEFTTSTATAGWLKTRRFFVAGQRDFSILADETRKTLLVSLSSNDLTVGTIPDWMQPGMYLVLADFGGNTYSSHLISSISAGHILLGTIPSAYPVGSAVYAGIRGWVSPSSDYDMGWFKFINPKMVFDEDPQFYLAEPTRSAFGTFNGREIWTFKPNQFEPITISNVSGMESVDFSLSRRADFDILGYTYRLFNASWTMREEEAEEVRTFFDRMRGQQGEFYMPTWEPDLTANTTATAGTNTLTITGPDTYNIFNGSTIYKCVGVFRDTTRIPSVEYNKITSMVIVGGNTVITFANNWAADVTTASIISWAPVWRLATDILDAVWVRGIKQDVVVKVSLALRMLEDLTGS